MRCARVACLCAVIAAKNLAVGLNAVADHATVTMATLRRKRVNSAFETVENVFSGFTFHNPNATGGCGCGSSFTA